jgi:hypothetical protein
MQVRAAHSACAWYACAQGMCGGYWSRPVNSVRPAENARCGLLCESSIGGGATGSQACPLLSLACAHGMRMLATCMHAQRGAHAAVRADVCTREARCGVHACMRARGGVSASAPAACDLLHGAWVPLQLPGCVERCACRVSMRGMRNPDRYAGVRAHAGASRFTAATHAWPPSCSGDQGRAQGASSLCVAASSDN